MPPAYLSDQIGSDLDAIDLQIAREALLCGVQLLQPGVVEAVIDGNRSVCQHDNPIAWDTLRGLLLLHFHTVAQAVADEGAEAAARHVRHSAQKVRERMRLVMADRD